MSHDAGQDTSTKPDVEELEETIKHHREDLAQTVDALSRKLDVKAQARHAVQSATTQVRGALSGSGGGSSAGSDPARLAAMVLGGVAVVALTVGIVRRNRR